MKTTNKSHFRLHRVVLIYRAMSWVLFLSRGQVRVFDKNIRWKLFAGFRVAESAFQDEVKQQRIVVIDFIEGVPFFRVDVT